MLQEEHKMYKFYTNSSAALILGLLMSLSHP